MKIIKSALIYTTVVLIAVASVAFINIKAADPVKNNGNKGFAVVELFTSEGCSSCPPADELVARVQKETAGQPVYILAFHVDYWNRLGWKDVFSDALYSKRQGDYANYLNLSSVYTPQIVVNGKKEFVGSQEGTLRNAIKAALQSTTPEKVTLDNIKLTGKQLTVHYGTENVAGNSELILALVQKSARTAVKAGENSGRDLSHVQIVRQLQSVPLNKSTNGTANIGLPSGFKPQGWEVLALVQNIKSGEITGAGRAEFETVSASL